MDYLLCELAGAPPYPDFDIWREIQAEKQAEPLEWLAAVNHADLGIDRADKEALLFALMRDARFRPRSRDRWRDLAARVPELAFFDFGDTRGTMADLVEVAEDYLWRREISRNCGVNAWHTRSALLARKCEEWKLTRLEGALFRLLDSLRENNASDDVQEPYPAFRCAGVSESYIVGKLWAMRLKDLATKEQAKARASLRKLQERTNAKIAEYRNDLRIDRPRPGALAIAWVHPRHQRPPRETVVENAIAKIEEILTRIPSGWMPRSIVTRTLGRDYRLSEIEGAKQRLGIIASLERVGEDVEEIWSLPPQFRKMSQQ